MADESEYPTLTFAEIKKLKVAELKSRLSSLGLPVSGLKADLVARLASFLESAAIQAKLKAGDGTESETADEGESADVSEGPSVTSSIDIVTEPDGSDKSPTVEPSEPSYLPGEQVQDDQVQAVVGQVVAEVVAEQLEGYAPVIAKQVEGDTPSAESDTAQPVMPFRVVENITDFDNQKDAMEVEQIVVSNENTTPAAPTMQPEDKMPEIQQESAEIHIQEERRIEIQSDRYADSQPDEIGVEIQPDETQTKLRTQETEQTVTHDRDEIRVEQKEIGQTEEIRSDIATSSSVESKFDQEKQDDEEINVDQPGSQEDSLSGVVESDQSGGSSGEVGQEIGQPESSGKDMETGTVEESVPKVSIASASQEVTETNENMADKQSHQSLVPPEEPLKPAQEETPPSEPRFVLPHPPVLAPSQAPSHPAISVPTYPQSQFQQFSEISPPQAPNLPPQVQPSSPVAPQISSHSPMEDKTEHTALVQPSTSPRSTEPPPKDVSPEQPTPQEPVHQQVTPPRGTLRLRATPPPRVTPLPKHSPPPRVTPPKQNPPSPRETIPPPPDPLAEAKAKARNVVEMRERRLNEEGRAGTRGDDSGYDVDHYDQEGIPATESRQEKKKKKKKKRKKRNNEQPNVQNEAPPDDEGIEVEYVAEMLDHKDPVYAQFASIFETFKLSEKPEVAKKDEAKEKSDDKTTEEAKKDDDDMDTDSEEEETQKKEEQPGEKVEKLSKKKLKLKNRMSVAELKQTVHRPDVVEMHDVTAPDPKLLVYLKACRNTVPVPRHWCFKRKFLQGKRGIIKPPFQLPEFIQKTGIMEMREALQEKEDAKNMKAKMREKIRPKMGKIDIDYQKLHDAFFKWQTKPKMSIHGDLYYEGKEFETKLKEKKPGDLSEDLRTALGMPTGQGSNLVPPPWLIAMQRYGPPPSYPNLKIPGLNAPIPEGASFGYHAGGWGKPPVDEHGRPLYGDVFGVQQTDGNLVDDEQVDSNLWGELESESEESEESEEESEEEAPDQSGLVTPAETGLVTPSGLTSIPAGMETPDMIELRKRKNIEDAMESGSEQPSLYTVLPEKRAGVGGMMMGTSHVYDLATAAAPGGARRAPGGLSEGVEVALDPSELELDPAAMQARYDEQLREQQNIQKEDLSDMVAEHAARQQKKRKKTTESGKAAKKYKEFKF